MKENVFSIREVFGESYSIISTQFWKIIAQFGALIIAGFAVSFFFRSAGVLVVGFGSIVMALSYATKGSFTYNDIFEAVTLKKIVYYILAALLTALAVAGGLIVFIIPGLVLMSVLAMVKYIAVDRDITPRKALKLSAIMTKGYRLKIFCMVIIAVVINLIGAIFLLVGLLYTMPLTQIAFALVYKKLTQRMNDSFETVDVVETLIIEETSSTA